MTVTKFPSTHTLIPAALHAAFVGVAFATGAGGIAPSAHAGAGPGEESNQRRFRIPAGPLGPALSRFATAAGVRLSFDHALTEGQTTLGLMGDFTREEGLAALLAGTGLEWAPGPGGTYTVRPTARAQATPEVPMPTGEQPAPLEPILLDPITVIGQSLDQGFKANMQETATKMPLPIRETPQSISVITQDALEARQALDIGQALQTAAGVNQFSGVGPFAGRGSFGLGQTQIRGIGSNFFTDRDEGFLSPIFAARPDLAPYERIEVLKGPSATLYGRSSAGGFVNRVRKKPLPAFKAEVAPSIGSFDFYRAEGDVTGPLFESDRARGRLVLAYENAGAFVDGVESERVVVAPSLDFDLTDSTRLLLQGTYQRDDFLPNPGFPLVQDGDIFRAPNVRRSLYFGVPNENEENTEIRVGIAQLEQELGDDWLATLRLNRTATRQRAGAENYAYGITPAGDTTLFASRLIQDNDVWSGEIRLNGHVEVLGRPANVTLGMDYTNFEFVNDQEYATLGIANIYEENFADFPTQPTTPSFDGLDVQEGTGVYAQIQFRPFERLSVLLGGRYDWTDTSFENRMVSGSKVEKRAEAFTGRAGLTFDVTDQVSVYGLFAESFDPVTDPGANGQILDPETGEIYELGIKSEWLDGKLGITAAVFRLDRDNIPIAALTGPGEDPFSISAGLQRSEGIELEINGEPLSGWNISFGGVLLDSEFKDGPFVGSLPGGTADWQVGLFTSYELQGGPLNGLGFGVGLFAIDDRGASTFVPGATLEGYERVDLHAFYNGFKPLRIALQVRNVVDERYVEGADRVNFAQFGSPTAALLTVRYDFGG